MWRMKQQYAELGSWLAASLSLTEDKDYWHEWALTERIWMRQFYFLKHKFTKTFVYSYRDLLDLQVRRGQKDSKDFLEWKVFQDQKETRGIQDPRDLEDLKETG
jgi:hypothetical protein